MTAVRVVIAIIFVTVTFIILLEVCITDHQVMHPKEAVVNTTPSQAFISVVFGGQLGNNIWEYMSMIALMGLHERDVNFTAYVSPQLKRKMKSLFERNDIKQVSKIPCWCSEQKPYILSSIESFKHDDFFRKGRCHVILAKYSNRYNDIIEFGIEKIKKQLRFHKKYIQYSNDVFNNIKKTLNMSQENVTFVGMHYRGTDYNSYLKKKYKNVNVTLNSTFYLKAMNYFKRKYKTVVFILITVDLPWLKNNLSSLQKNNTVIVNPNDGDIAKDLILLSRCNHSIISYGTYGTTAALFAGGTTFVYDLGVPLDDRGSTVAMGMAQILPNWHLLT